VVRRDGKLKVKGLRTTDLKEATRRLRDEGIISLICRSARLPIIHVGYGEDGWSNRVSDERHFGETVPHS
jgi:hypothetical protein